MPKDPTASSKRAPKLDCDGNPVKTKRVKKEKDPNAPKRPLSAYMYFSQDWRERIKTENPDVSFGEIGRLLGLKWKGLSEEEKKPYEDMASRDKKRHEAEKAEYERS
ncbi:Non-histone chromosomal protein 6 [Puccinia graminis f. sp. tritici]|uniref:High mobility group protein B1 n=2 Tax=Puccinia graminis f. sp. tritici TaxID=56615 RepID=E3K3U3_PUCGT|nr:high mobility group protein B1 [Puccinia graminis f. sp. tritici CRL 75-36-700-3]KAA1069788.1 Non-histone chromosomal protein 6 [Puccinia graminis f. sp. tritici]EFP78745.1 high mobility group protein B1 [Puccinia graminis f. sp. tritici CRL 75-36-700-3]KAA1098971.1 Non-histone chromosomal protein 6 [Puccinia graminis f. sp. tritici]KAA1104789.1 Non-histone chromosomal protein 6 [Puccinia graminis f. sp. tritici]KAA1133290.1 Non-histone chromosomal protein 6 [Puccinia graminis f. sp. tritic